VRAIGVTIKAHFLDPAVNDAGVLPIAEVRVTCSPSAVPQ